MYEKSLTQKKVDLKIFWFLDLKILFLPICENSHISPLLLSLHTHIKSFRPNLDFADIN